MKLEDIQTLVNSNRNEVVFYKPLNVIPVIASVLFALTCVVPWITSLLLGRKFPLAIPTVSESAREFPGSRVFNIGLTIVGILTFWSSFLIVEIPSLHGMPLPKATRVFPYLVCSFFILVSGFGLDDNVFIHLTCALLGFFSIAIFSVFIFFVYKRMNQLAAKKPKLIFLILGVISLISLAITWPMGNKDPVGSIKSLSEFVFLLSFSLFTLTWTADLNDIQINMEVEFTNN